MLESHVFTLALIANLPAIYFLAPIGGLAALAVAFSLAGKIRQQGEGSPEQIKIAQAVREGAMAYLTQQYKVVFVVFILLIGLLGVLWVLGLQPLLSMVGVPIAGLLSGLTGYIGMKTATGASARTAAAAKLSLNDGLQVAFRAGAVMGLCVVGFALLDVSVWLFILTKFGDALGILPVGASGLAEVTAIMLSFGIGASTQALFARVGGGIFTKAADVGGDLVGKVEAGIPEDDARNPATIADNVGDNVGDVAGMGADLYESYYGSILACLALGAAAAASMHSLGDGTQLTLAIQLVIAPVALAGAGILASILGVLTVKTREEATFSDLLGSLRSGVYVASAIIILAAFGIPYLLLGMSPVAENAGIVPWWRIGLAIIAGLISGLVIAQWTEYCTSYENAPTKRIIDQAHTGPATVIIAGIAEGMKSTWASLLAVVVAILVAFIAAGGNDNFLMGLYGVSIAAVGMLSTLGITLATDAYGPIADNAGGNAQMSGQPPFVRERTDMLDSLGNTTAATGKGFAIGSAALTALALIAAYVQVVQTQLHTQTVKAKVPAVATEYPAAQIAAPHAFYLGNGRFQIKFPGEGEAPAYTGGGLLVDLTQLPPDTHFDEVIVPGSLLKVEGFVGVGGGSEEPKPMSDEPGKQVAANQTQNHTHDHDHDHDHAHSHDHAAGSSSDPKDALVYVLSATSKHGDHEHSYRFNVISTANATLHDVVTYYDATLTNPKVLAGMFIGVMLSFIFCALTMSAVGRAAFAMMSECRRQFAKIREGLRLSGKTEAEISDPNTWPQSISVNGHEYPDFRACVSISTAGAQREMVIPSLLAILVPIFVGLTLSVAGVLGMLVGGLTSGFAVAVFMANAGGAWDNAKKYIESVGKITASQLANDPTQQSRLPAALREVLAAKALELTKTGKGDTIIYGKGSDDHKAAVVGDTVGDPFKDTSGPSLNILIKLIAIVSVVLAGAVVSLGPTIGSYLGLD